MKIHVLLLAAFFPFAVACSQNVSSKTAKSSKPGKSPFPEAHDANYWKPRLNENAYEIMVNRGTEAPFHNAYFNNHLKGVYVSAATGDTLFTSETKFESGTGWPSFYETAKPGMVKIVKDDSYGMTRDEVVEAKTGLHLGHLFMDGPEPTGKRYCMNSGALKFIPAKTMAKAKK